MYFTRWLYSAKYEVDSEVLPQELQQLGLPQGNKILLNDLKCCPTVIDICKAIVREYTAAATAIRDYLIGQTLHCMHSLSDLLPNSDLNIYFV